MAVCGEPLYTRSRGRHVTHQLSEVLFSGGAAAQRRHHLLQLLDEVWEHRHQMHHKPETETGPERVRTRTDPTRMCLTEGRWSSR